MSKNPCLDCRIDNARRAAVANTKVEGGRVVKYAPMSQQAMTQHMDNEKARAKSKPCERHMPRVHATGLRQFANILEINEWAQNAAGPFTENVRLGNTVVTVGKVHDSVCIEGVAEVWDDLVKQATGGKGADSRLQGNPVEHGGVWDGLSERELFLRRRAK